MQSRLWHRFFLRIALAGAHVFAWIFVFQYSFVRTGSITAGIASAALTYGLAHAIAVIATPLAAQRLRNGFKSTIAYAVVLLACAFGALAAAFAGMLPNAEWGIGLFALFFGLYRALYWIPYAVARERLPRNASLTVEIILSVLPLAAGFYLASSAAAPVALLGAAAMFCVLSLVPLLSMPDGQEGYSWEYRESFHELFARPRRYFVISAFLSGVESMALFLLWPLLVFLLLKWSYPVLGLVITVSALLTLAIRYRFGRHLTQTSVPLQAVIAASAWVARLTIGGALGVIVIDTYFHAGSRSAARGNDLIAYEHAADSSTFVDEHTALKEMGMGMGRVALSLVVAVMATCYAPVAMIYMVAFGIAALAAVMAVYVVSLRPRAL